MVGAAASRRQLILCALEIYFRESSFAMNSKPPDPGGGPGWRRRNVNNIPQPGVFRDDGEIIPTWAGIAAGAAKNRHELHNEKGVLTQTICVHLTRDSSHINYNLTNNELEYLLYDCIGLELGKLVWCDRSFFRTLVFGVEENVDTKKLALGISHTIRKGLRSKAVKPVASEVNLKIFWTQYGASTSEITESLNNFGTVIGEFKNQTFPETRKDGKSTRLTRKMMGNQRRKRTTTTSPSRFSREPCIRSLRRPTSPSLDRMRRQRKSSGQQ